ncbi:Mercuric resistance operon regulatory protein [Cellulomonas sp. T2.31MG-18]|uniref:heavy metal-responsive transcriptional regulator n=1 Tax=Cellulomonas sp. T2.31MG-18 TaxID=3157619 RepID=UPI0035F09DEC
MLIGELGRTVGLPGETIRFYERRGLLPTPTRGSNGYRNYDDSAVARVQFIRAAQAAGFSLDQIRGIVDLRNHGRAPCSHVAQLIDGKLTEVQGRIRELVALQEELHQLRERARVLDPADCTDADICRILSQSL